MDDPPSPLVFRKKGTQGPKNLHGCMYVCIYICMYLCTYVYICMHVFMHIYIYVCIYIYVYVCIYVCMYVCISIESSSSFTIMMVFYQIRLLSHQTFPQAKCHQNQSTIQITENHFGSSKSNPTFKKKNRMGPQFRIAKLVQITIS